MLVFDAVGFEDGGNGFQMLRGRFILSVDVRDVVERFRRKKVRIEKLGVSCHDEIFAGLEEGMTFKSIRINDKVHSRLVTVMGGWKHWPRAGGYQLDVYLTLIWCPLRIGGAPTAKL